MHCDVLLRSEKGHRCFWEVALLRGVRIWEAPNWDWLVADGKGACRLLIFVNLLKEDSNS